MIPPDVLDAVAALDAAARRFAEFRVPESCPDDGYLHVDDVPVPDRITARHVRGLRAARDRVHAVVGRHVLEQTLTSRR